MPPKKKIPKTRQRPKGFKATVKAVKKKGRPKGSKNKPKTTDNNGIVKNKGGRPSKPSKMTPKVVNALLGALRLGYNYDVACHFAKVDTSTFYRWRVKGKAAKSGKWFEFMKSVYAAEAESEAILIGQMRHLANNNLNALKWLLEKRFPDKYAPKQKLEHTIDPNQPIEIVVEFTDDWMSA